MERKSFEMLKTIQETFLTNLVLIWVVCRIEKMQMLDFYRVTSLKQRSAGKHVAPLWHIILIPGQTGFDLSLRAVGLAEKQQIPILLSFISHQGGGIWFLCVKSWFFTPNTPKIFTPPPANGKNMIFPTKYPKYFRASHRNWKKYYFLV
jgi:hypothetical protein